MLLKSPILNQLHQITLLLVDIYYQKKYLKNYKIKKKEKVEKFILPTL